jgi:hypothetical protein
MKFFSIFCHTITTHTCREPHALASPTVNSSSLEKEGQNEERRGRPTSEKVPFYVPFPKATRQSYVSYGDTVQRSIDCTDRKKEGKSIPSPPPHRCIVVF